MELLLLLLLSRFSCVRLCATPSTAAHQAPLSLGFSWQDQLVFFLGGGAVLGPGACFLLSYPSWKGKQNKTKQTQEKKREFYSNFDALLLADSSLPTNCILAGERRWAGARTPGVESHP